jgi:hypothetical protein
VVKGLANGGDLEIRMRPMTRRAAYLTILLFLLFTYVPSRAEAQGANGTWTTIISPAADGTKTAISFSNSGTVSTGLTVDVGFLWSGLITGTSGMWGAPAGAFNFSLTNFPISPVGYVENVTTGIRQDITGLAIGLSDGVSLIGFTFAELSFLANDVLVAVIDPTPATLEIDLDFSGFTPGTYNAISPLSYTPGPDVALNMEIVPEPSTYALLALAAAGLGGLVLRRHRR